MVRLSFNVFVQFQPEIIGWFRFNNKINFCITMLILLLLVWYSLLFYVMVYSFERKKMASILLNQSDHFIEAYIKESVCRVLRNLIRGFFHGFLMQNYRTQIICLAWSNAIYLIFVYFFSSQTNTQQIQHLI